MNDERTLGRPRDEDAGPALLDAARRLVLKHGYEAVSIGMITAEAGVGRQTLYRRWKSKAELVLDAFFQSVSSTDQENDLPAVDALALFLRGIFANLTIDGPAIRHLIASAQSDVDFLSTFKDRFVMPRSEVAVAIVKKAIADGDFSQTTDLEVVVATLHGAFWYRLLLDEPLNEEFAHRLAKFIVKAAS